MKKIITLACALSLVGLSGASAQVIYKTINQTDLNLSWVFVSGASGFNPTVADLSADFTSFNNVTLSPTVRATNAAWYNPEGGGVDSVGTKTLTSFLYGRATDLNQSFSTIELSGNVTDFSLGTNIAGTPYTFRAIIRDISNVGPLAILETILPLTSDGPFTVSHNFVAGTNRRVEWGLQLIGPNIWPEDTVQLANAGSVTVVPEPSTYALLGLAAAGGLLIRRFRRKA